MPWAWSLGHGVGSAIRGLGGGDKMRIQKKLAAVLLCNYGLVIEGKKKKKKKMAED